MSLVWSAAAPELVTAFRAVSGPLSASDFYLAGGTALTLQIGHRRSVDLDLFSPTLRDVEALLQQLSEAVAGLQVTSVAPRTLLATVGGVQVSFFGYTYPLLAPTVSSEAGLLPLAGLDDIAAMKLSAIASRGSRKDFVDLWFVVRSAPGLSRALRAYEQKFAAADRGHVVRSLTYFDDAEQEAELVMIKPAPWAQVKADLRTWVEELFDQAPVGGREG